MALKLTKDQIAALARTIRIEITEPIVEHNAKVKNSDEFRNFEEENEDCIILNKIADKYRIPGYVANMISSMKKVHFEDKLKDASGVSLERIEDTITLKTIECDNIQEVIEAVKSKFVK